MNHIKFYTPGVPICRNEGNTTRIEGYAAVWHDPADPGTEFQIGRFNERIRRGAFSESLAGSDVVALFNHDPNIVLGRSSAGTLTLSEDARGLRYSIDASAGAGRQIAESVSRGDIRGSSFSANIEDASEAREDGRSVIWLERLDLVDVGPVTFPAYSGTEATARSLALALHGKRSISRRRRLRYLTLDLLTSKPIK